MVKILRKNMIRIQLGECSNCIDKINYCKNYYFQKKSLIKEDLLDSKGNNLRSDIHR